jgi:hypothetical protein
MSKMKNHHTERQAARAAEARADRYTFTAIAIGLLSFAVFLSAFFVGSEFSIFPATASLLLVCASIVCFLLGSIHSDGPGVIHTAPARRPHAVPLSAPVNRPRVDVSPAPGTGCRAAVMAAPEPTGPTPAEIDTVAAYYRRNGQRLIRRMHRRGPDSFRVLTLGTGEERPISPRTVSLLAELENTFTQ